MIDWGATIPLLAAIGSAGTFIWRQIEKRFAAMEKKLAVCEDRDRNSQARREKHLSVIEVLWGEVDRLDPESRVLKRCKHLLDELKSDVKQAREHGE
jgi:hypothetical protein